MGRKNHKGFSNAKENIASDYNQKKSPPAKTNFIHAASEAYNKGNWEQCLKLLSSNNKQVGDNPRLLGLKGTCHKKLKNITSAEDDFKRSLSLDPSQADVLHNYAGLLQDIGQAQKAKKYALSAISFSSNINHLIRAAAICGDNNHYTEGLKIAKKAIKLFPEDSRPWVCYAELQDMQGDDQGFQISVKKALSINPSDVSALTHDANLKQKDGALEEAKSTIQKVLKSSAVKATIASQANTILGKILEAEGDLEKAIQCFYKSIELHEDNPGAYHSLSKHIKDKDKVKRLLQNVERNCVKRKSQSLSVIYFALSNFHHTLGNYSESSDFLGKASKSRMTFLPSNLNYFLSKIKESESSKDLPYQPSINQSNRIFIVGLPRCGSTLLESILSMNQQSIDLGEISALNKVIRQESPEQSIKENNSHNLENHSFDDCYLAHVNKEIPDTYYTIDKALANFMQIPTLHTYMPNAKVIYSKRHPLDHILSMLKANLAKGNNYTADVSDAARAIVACEETMLQYRKEFPGYILTNNYDLLVSNPKEEIQKIINFLGWEWNDNYLYPDKAKRVVRTASVLQVRKPINNKSLGGWKKYADLLGPAIPILQESGLFTEFSFDKDS